MEPLATTQSVDQGSGTNVRRFLARRGVVFIRETKDFGTIDTRNFPERLAVAGLIVAAVKGETRDLSHSLQLSKLDEHGFQVGSAAYIDYDEIQEILEAIDFIRSAAADMALSAKLSPRDYTEVAYSTKDSASLGVLQSERGLVAFVSLGSGGETVFLEKPALTVLKELIGHAKSHLESRGAQVC